MSSPDHPPTFDLVDEPWIGVRDRAGRTFETGIAGVLRQAHDLTGITGDIPTQTFAITRVLLAVLHRALDGPADVDRWEQCWKAEQPPVDAVDAYLERWRHRFDLLHPERPFFQVAGLHTQKGETSELEKLVADVPNGTPFFTTRIGQGIDLSFAEAARWVVHAQAFDPSGIKSGCVGDERVKGGRGYPIGVGWSGQLGGVLLEGATLKDTLLLNLIAGDHRPFVDASGDDQPAWEREPDGPAERVEPGRGEPTPHGPLDLYTWQSRRIRLVVAEGRVRRVLLGNGDRLTPQNRHVMEPHSAWRRSGAQEKKAGAPPVVYMPLVHDPTRTIWRGLDSMLPREATAQSGDAAGRLAPPVLDWVAALVAEGVLPLDHMVRVRTIGMAYGSQSSVISEVIDDVLALRALLVGRDHDLMQAAVDAVGAADAGARALGSLAANLTVAAGGEPESPRSGSVESAYAQLDRPFRRWLVSLAVGTDPTDAQTRWHDEAARVLRGLAADLQERSPVQAWTGREDRRGRLVTASHADAWFRRDLRRALPLAHPTPAPAA